jgi:hypothetical protein
MFGLVRRGHAEQERGGSIPSDPSTPLGSRLLKYQLFIFGTRELAQDSRTWLSLDYGPYDDREVD